MAKVSVHIVTWNSRPVLPAALASLRAQTFRDFALVVVDNASNDGSVDCVRELYPEATVLRNAKNLGFSAAHNQAIALARRSGTRFVLVMNPDIVLEPGFLKAALDGIEGHPEIGSLGGKLRRMHGGTGDTDPEYTDVIDSVGLGVKRHRRVVDLGSGETDHGQYDRPAEVFGVSGALAFYRLEALDEVQEASGEVFDEDFFAYQEDVDLAWRLRLLGWSAVYAPRAVAYHVRTLAGSEKLGLWRAFLARRRRSAWLNQLSTRNHLLLLAKNEDWSTALRHAPLIWGYETAKFFESLLFSPWILKAYGQALVMLPKMLKKRRRLMRRRQATARELRAWFR
jgi:GT2 family glycosyltransferase